MTDAEKALAIIKAWHDFVHVENHEIKKRSKLIILMADWDINTLTLYVNDTHYHFGVMDREDESGFSILIDQLYNHFCR